MPSFSALKSQFFFSSRIATLAVCFWSLLLQPMALHGQPAGGDRNLGVQPAQKLQRNNNQKLALIIGNAKYETAPLTNPINDARAISRTLRQLGFTVTLRENADIKTMHADVREFGDKLRAGGVGVFYYAGHGMQIKGSNYLIPVGSNIEREDEVAYSSIDAQAILDKMESAGNGMNFMILDACRNNPFIRNTRSGKAGLAEMAQPTGALLSFATAPGDVASDGTGENGLYTKHLLEALKMPGLKAEEVFKRVRTAVRQESGGKQRPWESSSLEGDFYFNPPPTPSVASVATVAAAPAAPTPQPAAITAPAVASTKPAPSTPAKPIAAAPPAQPAATAAVAPVLLTPPTPAIAPTRPPQGVDNQPTTNAFGISIGDTWRYQTVDKWKKEVTGNWSRRVTRFLADGSISLNDGGATWDADGKGQSVLRNKSNEGTFVRTWSPSFKIATQQLKANVEEANSPAFTHTKDGNTFFESKHDGSIKVIGIERITVPAGTFEAWKTVTSSTIQGKNSNGQSTYESLTQTSWYVPSIKTYVASDVVMRDRNLNIIRNDRHELVSYSVRGLQ